MLDLIAQIVRVREPSKINRMVDDRPGIKLIKNFGMVFGKLRYLGANPLKIIDYVRVLNSHVIGCSARFETDGHDI